MSSQADGIPKARARRSSVSTAILRFPSFDLADIRRAVCPWWQRVLAGTVAAAAGIDEAWPQSAAAGCRLDVAGSMTSRGVSPPHP